MNQTAPLRILQVSFATGLILSNLTALYVGVERYDLSLRLLNALLHANFLVFATSVVVMLPLFKIGKLASKGGAWYEGQSNFLRASFAVGFSTLCIVASIALMPGLVSDLVKSNDLMDFLKHALDRIFSLLLVSVMLTLLGVFIVWLSQKTDEN